MLVPALGEYNVCVCWPAGILGDDLVHAGAHMRLQRLADVDLFAGYLVLHGHSPVRRPKPRETRGASSANSGECVQPTRGRKAFKAVSRVPASLEDFVRFH
jgi:hypothetical protein